MTGLVIVVAVVLLILALEPARRRARRTCAVPFRPGAEQIVDRDRDRVLAEIAAIGPR